MSKLKLMGKNHSDELYTPDAEKQKIVLKKPTSKLSDDAGNLPSGVQTFTQQAEEIKKGCEI